MSDQAIPSSLTNLLSESATFGSRPGDFSVGTKLSNKFDAVDGSNPSTTLISQMENTAQDLMEYFNPSISEITGLLSANAEGAQYALHKFQSGIKEYRATQGPGKTVALGGFVRPRAFGIFAPAILGFQTSREAISTLVNQNGGTFGTVSTGGIVKKPTTSTLPRPTTAALPSYDLTWGVVGEDGDMKPPTTSPKPKAGRRPVVIGVRDGVDAFQYLLGRNLQIE